MGLVDGTFSPSTSFAGSGKDRDGSGKDDGDEDVDGISQFYILDHGKGEGWGGVARKVEKVARRMVGMLPVGVDG